MLKRLGIGKVPFGLPQAGLEFRLDLWQVSTAAGEDQGIEAAQPFFLIGGTQRSADEE